MTILVSNESINTHTHTHTLPFCRGRSMNYCTMKKCFGSNELGLFDFQQVIKTQSISTNEQANVVGRLLSMACMILMACGVLKQRVLLI